MAIARKGSRLITVDGVSYRWVVSEDSGYKVVVVQHGSGRGQRLEATTTYGDAGFPGLAVRPADVRRLIEMALEDGWAPDSDGPPFSGRYEALG